MNILFIGDIVGASGRAAVKKHLPALKQRYDIDFVIANGENAAHGKGITPRIYQELITSGIHCITLGNHAYSKSEILPIKDQADRLVFPVNLMPVSEMTQTKVFRVKDISIAVTNLMTQVFMENVSQSPFEVMDQILGSVKADIHVIDLHGEATSEKIAFAYQYKNDLGAVFGTHTHVQTADERIIDGCAFISDAGMTGPYESIIGRDIEEVLMRITQKKATKYTIAESDAVFCAVFVRFDENYRADYIERIQIRP